MHDDRRVGRIAELPEDELLDYITQLDDAEAQRLLYDWPAWARQEQLPPPGGWSTWLILAGRGFGKTRAGAEWVRAIAESNGDARFALVAANYAEARSIMVEGDSGLLSIAPPSLRPKWESSLKRLRWDTGAQATLYSAAEPEALRGPQHSHAWCDEIAKWQTAAGQATAAWDNLRMGLRLGAAPQIVATTTPRAVPLVRHLVADSSTVVTQGRTHDNVLNLPAAFIAAMEADYGGTRLGRQELDGELIEDVEGALWTRALIEECRVAPTVLRTSTGSVLTETGDKFSATVSPELVEGRPSSGCSLVRIVVGVDPPASDHGDACGIIVTALGDDEKGYVLADASVEGATPEGWARAVADAAERWQADRVVAEANQGGAMVAAVLRAANIALPVKLVHASRGKVARAEPVAALYEAGRVHHVGAFPRLEDELCGLITGGGYAGPGRSPDRADALVWALSELMLGRRANPRIRQ